MHFCDLQLFSSFSIHCGFCIFLMSKCVFYIHFTISSLQDKMNFSEAKALAGMSGDKYLRSPYYRDR